MLGWLNTSAPDAWALLEADAEEDVAASEADTVEVAVEVEAELEGDELQPVRARPTAKVSTAPSFARMRDPFQSKCGLSRKPGEHLAKANLTDGLG